MTPASRYRRANPDTPWTAMAAQVLDRVHRTCPAWRPNGLIANWYRDGDDSIAWHSDNEPALGHDPTVVSVSLGTTRTFLLKPRDGGLITKIDLCDGDLLFMGGRTQCEYLHSIDKIRQPTGARISLTFRRYLPAPGPAAR
jgi:alkylated DNA repair dioxygenase AlkB